MNTIIIIITTNNNQYIFENHHQLKYNTRYIKFVTYSDIISLHKIILNNLMMSNRSMLNFINIEQHLHEEKT